MAAKYQLITELYRRTGVAVAKNPQAWQGFLSSACRNYKCRFDEQLLIYAQRPDAVAVAKLETWNRQFKRWVNKDSKGIAVFDPKGRRNTLKYYFDVSDTHEGYCGSRPVPIWQMDERYEQAVMERLSDRFGDVESTDLASALMETAKNAVEDNLQDYFSQLKDCTKDSFLEELDDFNIEVIYRRLAANSVAFMLISRCGLDTNEFFDRDDFADIVNFNTPTTINAIGIATSDIAEMALREISQSIRNVQMAEKDQNRTFAQRTQAQYDKGRQQPERSEYNERNHLQQTGGLSYENDAALAEQHKPQGEDKFCPMTLKGVTYTEKAAAGEMLLAICKDYPMSAPTDIGRYRGFRMEIYYDTVNAHYCMNLCGKAKHKVDLGADAFGNLIRIENELSKLPARLEVAKTKKAETIAQLETAKEEIKKPFAFEDELKEKTERLNALNIELNLNEKDTSVMDTEPEQTEEQPERKCASRER